MHLSPDNIAFWQHGFFKINATIAITWILMIVLAAGSHLITRKLSTSLEISRWQNLLEIIVATALKQIEEVGLRKPGRYLGFIGTLFLFIAFSNLCTIFPGYVPPTGSLSTTAALAICVFFAVPAFGIAQSGLGGYLKTYLQPTFLMLPLNIISELSRTLALAVRLFGNIMSGTMILAINQFGDVHEGRAALNFSTWNRLSTKKQAEAMHESWKEVAEGEMPTWLYVALHPEARLSQADQSVLRAWLASAGGEQKPEGHED